MDGSWRPSKWDRLVGELFVVVFLFLLKRTKEKIWLYFVVSYENSNDRFYLSCTCSSVNNLVGGCGLFVCIVEATDESGGFIQSLLFPCGQVHTDIQGIMGKSSKNNQTSLGGRIASGLSNIYLPPLPPPVDMSVQRVAYPPRHQAPFKPQVSHRTPQRNPLRTSLK